MLFTKTKSMLATVLSSFKSVDEAGVFPITISNQMVNFLDDNNLGSYLNGFYCLNDNGKEFLSLEKKFQKIYYGADENGDLQIDDLQLPETLMLIQLGLAKKYQFKLKDSNLTCDWVKLI